MSLELVKTADGTGLTARNVPVGTAILHQASCTVQSGGTCLYGDHSAGAVLTAPDDKHLWLAAEPHDSSGRSLGGWTPRQQVSLVPAPPPPPVPPPVGAPLPGVCINMSPGSLADWQRAKADGAVVGRTDHGSFAAHLRYASETGMRLLWINHNLSDMGPLLAEYKSQPEAARKALFGFCHGNEQWQGAGVGPKMSGQAYGATYVKAASQARQASLIAPVLMQVRLAPDITDVWMKSLCSTSGLSQALIGNGIDTHNYMGRMTAPQRTNSMVEYYDTDGRSWGSQRYLKELDMVAQATGSNPMVAMTEYGTASAKGVPDSVGSATEVAKHITAMFEHLKQVGEGKVKTPAGRPVRVLTCTYYDQYAWSLSGAESYGFRSANLAPREEGGINLAYRTGAKSL